MHSGSRPAVISWDSKERVVGATLQYPFTYCRHGTEAVWSTLSIHHFQMHFWHSQAGTQAVIYPDVSQICKEPGQYKVQAYQRFSKILFNISSVCWDGGLMPFGGLWGGPRASVGVGAQMYKSTIMTTMVEGPKN